MPSGPPAAWVPLMRRTVSPSVMPVKVPLLTRGEPVRGPHGAARGAVDRSKLGADVLFLLFMRLAHALVLAGSLSLAACSPAPNAREWAQLAESRDTWA